MTDPTMGIGSHLEHLLGAFPTAWLAGWLGAADLSVQSPIAGVWGGRGVSLCYWAFLHSSPLRLPSPPPQHLPGARAVEKSALMNGDYQALCFTKHGQEIRRVLPTPPVDSLEKDNAMEERLEGARRAVGCAREEGSEAEGRSQGREHCRHSIHL